MEVGGNKWGPHHHDDHNGDHRIAPIRWFLVLCSCGLSTFFHPLLLNHVKCKSIVVALSPIIPVDVQTIVDLFLEGERSEDPRDVLQSK